MDASQFFSCRSTKKFSNSLLMIDLTLWFTLLQMYLKSYVYYAHCVKITSKVSANNIESKMFCPTSVTFTAQTTQMTSDHPSFWPVCLKSLVTTIWEFETWKPLSFLRLWQWQQGATLCLTYIYVFRNFFFNLHF